MFLAVRLAAVLAGCLALVCAPAWASPDPTLPVGFIAEPVATGLDQPTGIAYRPDGTAYVIEKGGKVYRVTTAGARSLWLDLNASSAVPPVNGWWDRGLVGVAVDGQWADHRFVYLSYVSDGWTDGADGNQDPDPHSSLVIKVPVAIDGSAGTPEVILGKDGMGEPCPGPHLVGDLGDGGTTLDSGDYNGSDCLPIDGDTHAVGTIRSAPDGTLYAGSGDGSPYDGLDKRTLRSQREDSLAGKIVHIDRDGKGLTGHAFCPAVTDLTKACAKIHAKGFRNPFRFALTPDGRLAVGDVGWGRREELTIAPAGANAGWPCWEGSLENTNYSWHDLCAPAVTTSRPRQPVGVTMPSWEYDRVGDGGAIVGGPVYTGTSYPEAYRGSLLVGDYAQGWLRHLPADGHGGWNMSPSVVTDWTTTSAGALAGTAFGSMAQYWPGVDIETHPANGDVVYADIGEFNQWGGIVPNTGRIVRIRYSPGNGRPVARATATPDSGDAPLQTTLSATGSTDPDADPLAYAWDVDGDGTTDATTATVTHTYATAGNHTAKLTVDDGHGLTATTTVQIKASETAPVAEILGTSDTTYAGNQPIALRGAAADAQDGTLSGNALRWDVQLIHADHTHPLGTYYGAAPAVPKGIDDHDSDSHYVITLTAADSAGLTDTATWRLDPRTATVKLRSEPAGARLSYAEGGFDTPTDHPSTIGLKTSLVAEESFTKNGATYVFEQWDTGATGRIRGFTVPQAGATLTARYKLQVVVPPVEDPPVAVPPAADPPVVTPPIVTPDPPKDPTEQGTGQRTEPGRITVDRLRRARRLPRKLTGELVALDALRRVEVAVDRRRGSRCAWWSRTRGRFGAVRACSSPGWIRATIVTGGKRWSLDLEGALPAGAVTIRVRALDAKGRMLARKTASATVIRVKESR
ncbi:MAG: PQQ-dependent sugar dehydrogenase [Solirubrobacteraceae bacterium]|nr:PQQ-dependent sugar dehydrogenase [Solirubrobacteraceae bacterium]